MSSLPARLVMYVLAPAVLGGAVAWGTRAIGNAAESGRAGPRDPQVPLAPAMGRGKNHLTTTAGGALAEQRRFCDRLRGATFEQMTEMLIESEEMTDAFRRRSARELILEQLARIDPIKAWAFVETWEKGNYQHDFVTAWARVDAVGALTWAEGHSTRGAEFRHLIVIGLVPDDVEGFVALLPRLKPEEVPENHLATAFRQLAGDDAPRAQRLAESLAAGGPRNSALYALGEGWARGHGEAAYAWATALTDPTERESALRGVFRSWAESDPQGVAAKLDELVQDGPKDATGEALARGSSPVNAIVRAWAAQDPQAAADWLKSRTTDDPNEFKKLFTSEILSTRDNWSAAEVAAMMRRPGEKIVTENKERLGQSMSTYGARGEGGFTLIGEFGGHRSPLFTGGMPGEFNPARFADPAQAFDELAQQPGDASRQHVLQEVATQWVAQDAAAAMAKLNATTDDFLKIGLLNAFSNLARQSADPALAAEVAKAYPDTLIQGRSLVDDVYSLIAQRDPDHARALMASDPQASHSAGLVSALATEQATYDPSGAVEWAADQPTEALQAAATQAAVERWAEDDAYAVSEWLTAQPAGPRRDAAVQSLVSVLRSYAPEEALQWASSLSDPQARESEQRNVVHDMINKDPAAARQLVDSIPFSEEAKRSLLQSIEENERIGN